MSKPPSGHRRDGGNNERAAARPKQADHKKDSDSMVCSICGVVNHAGRWSWGTPPLGNEHSELCPACVRVRDRNPASTLSLQGLPAQYRTEVERMLHNLEEREREEHPLDRMMGITEDGDALAVATTSTRLADLFARALGKRFHDQVIVKNHEQRRTIDVVWRDGKGS